MKVQKHHVSKDDDDYTLIDTLCIFTHEMYNECIRYINDYEDKHGTYKNEKGYVFSYAHLWHVMKNSSFMARGIHSIDTMKQVFRKVNSNYSSYIKALVAYGKDKTKFKGRPQRPKCKSNNGRTQVIIPSPYITVTKNSGYITVGGKKFIIDIPNIHNLEIIVINKNRISEIKEIILQPTRNGYDILVVYEKFDIVTPLPDNKKYLGIDIGVVCLAAIASNHLDWTPTMIKGSRLKNLITDNEYQLRRFRGKLNKKGNRKSKRISNILYNFDNRKEDYCHKISRAIVNMAIDNKMSKIVIGKNDFWKQGSKIGKLFQSIPYYEILFMIRYKAEDAGIEVIYQEESYTSKCSFLDMEAICKSDVYIGKRNKRSIFTSINHGTIHADINGALNILRKNKGDLIFDQTNIDIYRKSPVHFDITN